MAYNPPLRTDLRFWLFVPLAGVFTWAVHELAHYGAGRLLGYDMWMSMNQAGLIEGEYTSNGHRIVVTMAGPLVTYAQAGLAYWFARRRNSARAYSLLFFAFFTRLVAFGVSFANPNDEARTSLDLGLPMWLLPALVVALLFAPLFLANRALGMGWKRNLGIYGIAAVVTTAVVFGDPVVGRILG